MELTIDAPAKVNLCLAVQYPPQDGYHLLNSVFQTLDLHDTLEFAPAEPADAGARGEYATTERGTRVWLSCEGLGVAVRDNLIFRAVERMEQACGCAFMPGAADVSIRVDKRIPAGGGLGGGSSDAAAAIKAFAQFNGMDPLDAPCVEAARGLGADVPFFLYGGAALMTGRGDELVRPLPQFPLPLVLMGDFQGVSTAAVYAAFDDDPPQPADAFALAQAMEETEPDLRSLAMLCANNLEPAACAALPQLARRVAFAKASPHTLGALVTGSGATCYAICANKRCAQAFVSEVRTLCDWVYVAMPAQ